MPITWCKVACSAHIASVCKENTLVPDACEWGSRKQQFLVKIAQCVCRTMATPRDGSVKKEESETEKAGQSGSPGHGGIIRVEEVQATVEALVQKCWRVRELNPKPPQVTTVSRKFQVESLPMVLIPGR